ncbi:MAG: hypothetical protein WBQ46_07190, partial [Terriglobales bacterium]
PSASFATMRLPNGRQQLSGESFLDPDVRDPSIARCAGKCFASGLPAIRTEPLRRVWDLRKVP